MKTDELAAAGAELGRQAATKPIQENHLAMVIAHLQHHRDPIKTRNLVGALVASCFAQRSQSTQTQFQALQHLVEGALQTHRDWQSATQVLAWAKRTLRSFKGM